MGKIHIAQYATFNEVHIILVWHELYFYIVYKHL